MCAGCENGLVAGGGIHYARNGGVAIAYRVVGEGDVDLVYVPDYMSNLVYDWESPSWRRFCERLAESFRLILFDKRGTGLSDHGPRFAELETRMEDLRAVLDAVASARAVVFGANEGCGMAALFAATYPERTRALALFQPVAHGLGTDSREAQEELSRLREQWGEEEWCEELLRVSAPAAYADESYRSRFANTLRVGASPEVAYALNRAHFETDLRDALPAIRVPTLVLYRQAPFDSEADALETARLIAGAQPMRISGTDYFGVDLSPEIVDEIERFVAGEPAPEIPTSVLTTVMFTDLVRSTERASAAGDQAWREILSAHHVLVRRELRRFRGEERDTAGDGFFATFDGPARAIRSATSIVGGLRTLDLESRIGIHVGECEMHDGKPTGVAVNIGARVAALAAPGEILVTQTVRDLVAGSGFQFRERDTHTLKGVPGQWQLFAITGGE
jgi:class 3 adenylate cyclase/pimeloyl-ACP methyl ester carboxylesterase